MRTRLGTSILVASLVIGAGASAPLDLQQGLKDTQVAPHWVYDNLPEAFAQAKAAAKPLMVVFRCVP